MSIRLLYFIKKSRTLFKNFLFVFLFSLQHGGQIRSSSCVTSHESGLFVTMLITKIIIFKAFHISNMNMNMNISRCLYTFHQQHSRFQFYQTSGTSQGTPGVRFHQISRSSDRIFNDVQRNDEQRNIVQTKKGY